MGNWRGLASVGLCRLISLCWVLGASSVVAGTGTSRFSAALLIKLSGPDTCEERVEFDWEVEIVEKELPGRVVPS